MYAGTSYSKALEWAKANAKLDGQPRYVWGWLGRWHIEKDKPSDPSTCPYTEVGPNGVVSYS